MDVDWCLSCDRKLDASRLTSGPYCSPECLAYAQPTPICHPQTSLNTHRIHEWAAAIPPHVPAGAPCSPFTESPSQKYSRSPLPTRRPPYLRVRTQATPKLIKLTSTTTPVPTLGVSSPAHVRPLPPMRSSHCTCSNANTASNTTASMSEASTSLTSLLSEPLVATPEEGDCSFGIGALVRSWVHRDHEHANPSKEPVVQEIKSRFPHLSHPKKPTPPRSQNATTIRPASSPRVVRQKSPPIKRTPFPDHELSASPSSHTPTPVVFPSCRAVEFDWGNDDDRDSFVSQAHAPQYHSKYEPQARAPSPVLSNSSSGSSVLFMAPKRCDGIRGRRGGRVIVA